MKHPTSASSWDHLLPFLQEARRTPERRYQALGDRLRFWDEHLRDLGGDPCREDWSAFRPLRLSREEDWSDWLAHLLQTSKTGLLASKLLGLSPDAAAYPREVRREWSPDGGAHRADLVLLLRDARWIHIEVKVGDLSFDKTFDTADALRDACRAVGGAACMDFLLVPEEDLSIWRDCEQRNPGRAPVALLTWRGLAAALRGALVSTGETTSWRVWARAYLGVIEQVRLGRPPLLAGEQGPHPLPDPNTLSLAELNRYEEFLALLAEEL